jgi:D-glycero-alpha-D-manno-heptose-7-phosphate kinase
MDTGRAGSGVDDRERVAMAQRARERLMIISRTPLRVSFAGGGSDLPSFYQEEPGAVVATAIRKYIYITVNQKFDSSIRASYSVTEIVQSVDEIRHELIRECLRKLRLDGGLEITSISDIPSRGTGLGSSSSYTVGLLKALYAFRQQHVAAERLAREACEIEIERCQKPIGKQDQYAAAYGGLRFIQFNPDGTVFVDPVICSVATREALERHLLLMYTGVTRSATPILAEQTQHLRNGRNRAEMRRMVALARALCDALNANDLCAFGEILHESWIVKRTLAAGVTSPDIDRWYECARENGALGGKITGAGGGGFLLLFAPPEHHPRICSALPHLRPVPLQLEQQGTKIVYVEEADRD